MLQPRVNIASSAVVVKCKIQCMKPVVYFLRSYDCMALEGGPYTHEL